MGAGCKAGTFGAGTAGGVVGMRGKPVPGPIGVPGAAAKPTPRDDPAKLDEPVSPEESAIPEAPCQPEKPVGAEEPADPEEAAGFCRPAVGICVGDEKALAAGPVGGRRFATAFSSGFAIAGPLPVGASVEAPAAARWFLSGAVALPSRNEVAKAPRIRKPTTKKPAPM
jgi:hypothetical protein